MSGICFKIFLHSALRMLESNCLRMGWHSDFLPKSPELMG